MIRLPPHSERIGGDWLREFRERFSEEFPEDDRPVVEIEARRAVEAKGTRPAKEGRYV